MVYSMVYCRYSPASPVGVAPRSVLKSGQYPVDHPLTHTANTTPCTLHGPQWRNDGPPTETDTQPYEAERGGGAA